MSNNRKKSRNYIKPVDSASRHDRTGKSDGHIIDGNARNERYMQRLAYIESLNQLRMHAPLIWKRNVFFMTVQGALMVYVFDKFANLMFFQKLILCTLGLTCSIAWLIITKSGQTIQRKWRKLAIQKENNYFQVS